MSDGKFNIEMTMDQAKVVQGLLQVLDNANKVATGVSKVSKEAAQAEREMRRMAKSIIEANDAQMSPQDRYKNNVNNLNLLRAQGSKYLNEHDYNAALKREKDLLRKNDPILSAAEKQAEQYKKEVESLKNRINEPSAKQTYQNEKRKHREMESWGDITREERIRADLQSRAKWHSDDPGLRKKAAEAKKAADEIAKADAEMKAFIARTKELNATPLEKYAAKMRELKAALASGMDKDTYERAAKAASDELDNATNKSKKAFGSEGVAELARYAAGVFSISTAVNFVSDAFQKMAERRDEAFSARKSLENEYKKLLTVSEPGEALKLRQQAADLAVKYSVPIEQATGGLFAAKSASLTEQETKDLFETYRTSSDIETPAKIMGLAKRLFGNDVTPRQAYNIIGRLSALAEGKPEEFAQFMPSAMNVGRDAKATFSETAAIVTLLSDAEKGPSMGVDRARALFGHMSRFDEYEVNGKPMKDMGFMEKLDTIYASPHSKEWQKDVLKEDIESNEAMNILREKNSELKKRIAIAENAKTATGTKDDWMAEKNRETEAIPQDQAMRAQVSAEAGAQQVKMKKYATWNATQKAIDEKRWQLHDELGTGAIGRASDRMRNSILSYSDKAYSWGAIETARQARENFVKTQSGQSMADYALRKGDETLLNTTDRLKLKKADDLIREMEEEYKRAEKSVDPLAEEVRARVELADREKAERIKQLEVLDKIEKNTRPKSAPETDGVRARMREENNIVGAR